MDSASITATDSSVASTHTLPINRIIQALRRRHPTNTAKHVARAINASPRTIEGYLRERNPQAPSWRHWLALTREYPELVTAVHPGHVVVPAGSLEAKLEAALAELARSRAASEALIAAILEEKAKR